MVVLPLFRLLNRNLRQTILNHLLLTRLLLGCRASLFTYGALRSKRSLRLNQKRRWLLFRYSQSLRPLNVVFGNHNLLAPTQLFFVLRIDCALSLMGYCCSCILRRTWLLLHHRGCIAQLRELLNFPLRGWYFRLLLSLGKLTVASLRRRGSYLFSAVVGLFPIVFTGQMVKVEIVNYVCDVNWRVTILVVGWVRLTKLRRTWFLAIGADRSLAVAALFTVRLSFFSLSLH